MPWLVPDTAGARAVLTLFVRPNCSLCEQARALLAEAARGTPVTLRLVDVESDAALEAEYGERIPVGVAPDGEELFEFAVDVSRVGAVIARVAAAR